MTKLNLLGAQRVKALTEILERKYADVIKVLQQEVMSDKEATLIFAEEKGLTSLIEEIQEAVNFVNDKQSIIREKLGMEVYAELRFDDYRGDRKVRQEIRRLKNGGAEAKIAKLKRELEDKKSQLWLVETLEQAQDIVNSEIKID